MKKNSDFVLMSIKSDLMRIARRAGRLNYPESYKLWIAILEKSLNKLNSLPQNKQNSLIKNYPKKLILPKKKFFTIAGLDLNGLKKFLMFHV